MSPTIRVAIFGVLVPAVVCGGCAGGATSGSGSGDATTTVVTVTEGGTLATPGGPTLTVPPYGLAQDTSISMARSSASAPAWAISPVFTFTPSGLEFAAPASVSFPVATDEAAPTVYWSSLDGTAYDALPTTFENGVATASVTHFSSGFVGFPPGCHDGLCGSAAISASPAVADFGEYDDSLIATFWGYYNPLTITISNRGDAPATLGGLGFSNAEMGTRPVFYIGTGETLPAQLAPGASTSFSVGFYTAGSGCYSGGFSFVANDRVNEIPASGWRIVAPMTLGPDITLATAEKVTVVPRDADGGAVKRCTQAWTSADSAIATVSNEGVITGISPGTTQVSVDILGYSASVAVTVRDDRCGAAGTWNVQYQLTSATSCGLTDGGTQPNATSFVVSEEVALSGGFVNIDGWTYTFSPETCTLSYYPSPWQCGADSSVFTVTAGSISGTESWAVGSGGGDVPLTCCRAAWASSGTVSPL